MQSVVAVIRASALQHNLSAARRAAPGCPVMAVIKADAYGHGLVETARVLEAADAFAVARLPEAIALRAAGIESPLVCLSGFPDAEHLDAALRHDVQLVLHARHHLDVISAAPGRQAGVWLKFDTGMGRLGFPPRDAEALIRRVHETGVRLCGLMTHLACADDRDDPTTPAQLDEFGAALAGWGGDISIANSAGLLGWPDSTRASERLTYAGRNWVRPGLMLYGVSPFMHGTGIELGLRPAMSLVAPVMDVRDIGAGRGVGYGGTWRAARDSRVAVIAAGYGDGVPWRIGGRSSVAIGGNRAPLVGRVSMDLISVDVTDLPAVSPGDVAELWGESQAVEKIAQSAGTIPYEILTSVNARVPREYVA